MSRPSYDDNQAACVLRTCPECFRVYWMPTGRTICVECGGGCFQPRTGTSVPKMGTFSNNEHGSDVNGVPIQGDY